MNLQPCIDELLMRGCDDWLFASEVASVAQSTGWARSEDEIRELSLNLIREVVLQGLMEIGDYPQTQHLLKHNLSPKPKYSLDLWLMTPQECVARVEREWRALGRNPSLWEICWLQNTSKGDALGEALLKNTPQ